MRTLKIASLPVMALGLVVTGGQIPAGQRTLFIRAAVEHADGTATFPLYRGTSHGDTVYYVILETSDGELSQALGVNRAQKLRNARGTPAVQKVTMKGGMIDFPATVDFRPEHLVDAPDGFPPARFQPGAIGEPGYSPLIELAGGRPGGSDLRARPGFRSGRG